MPPTAMLAVRVSGQRRGGGKGWLGPGAGTAVFPGRSSSKLSRAAFREPDPDVPSTIADEPVEDERVEVARFYARAMKQVGEFDG